MPALVSTSVSVQTEATWAAWPGDQCPDSGVGLPMLNLFTVCGHCALGSRPRSQCPFCNMEVVVIVFAC